MIYMWFTSKNYYNLAVEKDRDSIFTTVTPIWNPGTSNISRDERKRSYRHIWA
jgi:hypothetical protein